MGDRKKTPIRSVGDLMKRTRASVSGALDGNKDLSHIITSVSFMKSKEKACVYIYVYICIYIYIYYSPILCGVP